MHLENEGSFGRLSIVSTLNRKIISRSAVLFALGILLAVVPLPTMSFSTTSVLSRIPLPVLSEVSAAEKPNTGLPDIGAEANRLSGVQVGLDSFNAIGILFEVLPSEPVFIRTRSPEGTWNSWRELEIELDEGPEAGSLENNSGTESYGTEPIWVQDAVGYELNLDPGDAASAEVALVRDEMQRSATETTPIAGASISRPFDIHTRGEWGARPTSTSTGSTVKLAVIHHSASSNSYSPEQVPEVLRSIQAYHMDGRGWADIAYNFVVDKYGGVWEGRGGGIEAPVIGAHAMGFNTNSVGVMVLGDYTATTPSDVAIESVSQVIGWKMAIHGVDPSSRVAFTSAGSTSIPANQVVDLSRVVGHQDVGATGCPGSIYNSLSHIRIRARDWANHVRAVAGEPSLGDQPAPVQPPVGMPNRAPIAAVEEVVVKGKQVTISGWALDADSVKPLILVTFNGVEMVRPQVVLNRLNIWNFFKQLVDQNSGWSETVSTPSGTYDVCVYVADVASRDVWAGVKCSSAIVK